jgi:ankyrin repeat protein
MTARNGHVGVVQILLQAGTRRVHNPTSYGCVPLSAAAKSGSEDTVRLLLRSGVSTLDRQDAEGVTAIYQAAKAGHLGVLRVLLEAGASGVDTPDFEDVTPLYIAAQEGHADVVASLLQACAQSEPKWCHNPNQNSATPLLIAADKGVRGGRPHIVDSNVRAHLERDRGLWIHALVHGCSKWPRRCR